MPQRLLINLACLGLLLSVSAVALAAPPASPPATPPAAPAAPRASEPAARWAKVKEIDAAVKMLTEEAMDLDAAGKPEHPAHFDRPHPALKAWTPDMAPLVLQRMQGKFTGDDHRDTYIRWHLLWVLQKAEQQDKRQMGKELVKLAQMLPGPVDVKERPEHRYEPPEIASRYFSLVHSARITVGYPPFQRIVDPPESYQYMTPDQVTRAKANIEEAKKLRDQFKTIVDRDAIAFNRRVRRVNHIVRTYRGELIYLLLQTGDPKIAQLVVSEIDRQVSAKSGVALDLVAYMYLAAFDGVLSYYDAKTLQDLGAKLELTARASEGYLDYGGEKRNFADYAFHLILMLQQGNPLIKPKGPPS
ncbi:MAG: hypothetical protein WD042_20435 [Phycisphaeraceae bacterium]